MIATGLALQSSDVLPEHYIRRLGESGEGPHDIAMAALMLAALDHPHSKLNPYYTHLSEIGEAARAEAAFVRDGEAAANALGHVLAARYGYDGDRMEYDEPGNADLISVMERRRGLPVALGVLYMHAARAAGLSWFHQPGEGAFYGPKLEFVLRDRLGRAWQCGTIQVDLVLPDRFELGFRDGSGGRHRPVVLHRALVGSLERFLGIVLEHHHGRLPAWLAPEQVVVASIEPGGAAHARNALRALREAGLRARLDDRDEALSRKVADAHRLAVPYLVAAGPRDEARGSVRLREVSGAQHDVPLGSLAAELSRLCAAPAPEDE